TTQGFYSAVQDLDDPNRILVRARAPKDLEALREQIPDLQTQDTSDAEHDYGWRAFVTRDQWTEAVARLAGEIDYGNFKNAVHEQQGPERAHIYMRVWTDLLELQERADR